MLADADFTFVSREVKARTGAVLKADMSAAAEQRLIPLARREGFASVPEFIGAARSRQDQRLWAAVADALVQSDTRFFRDRETFKQIREEILPALAASRAPGEPIRIWAAGVAAGQEAYSLAMIAEEWRDEGGPPCEILATDFSERLLEKARSGLYTQFEIQRGLPIRKLIAYFEKAGDLWRITDRLRAAVRFQKHNLLQEAIALVGEGRFDLILLRNVLTPMDDSARLNVLHRIAEVSAPDAVLVLGANEELPPNFPHFQGGANAAVRRAA